MNSNLILTNVDIICRSLIKIERVHNITRTNALNPKHTPTTNQPQRVPLVITYHPALRYVSSIFHKHFNILSSSPRCSNVFKAKPVVAFRRSNNLSNLLVSATLRKPATITNQPRGSFRCGKKLPYMQLHKRRTY